MDARLLTQVTNLGLLAGVGLGSGHILMPARASASLLSRVVFIASVAGTGALAGWRERRSRENDLGEEVRGSELVWIATGALAALVIAGLAYELVHG